MDVSFPVIARLRYTTGRGVPKGSAISPPPSRRAAPPGICSGVAGLSASRRGWAEAQAAGRVLADAACAHGRGAVGAGRISVVLHGRPSRRGNAYRTTRDGLRLNPD